MKRKQNDSGFAPGKYFSNSEWEITDVIYKVPGWHVNSVGAVWKFTVEDFVEFLSVVPVRKTKFSINDSELQIDGLPSFSIHLITEELLEIENEISRIKFSAIKK